MLARLCQTLCLIVLLGSGIASAQDAIREEVRHKERPAPKLTKPPQLIKFVPAEYPAAAQDKGIQGTVELFLDLDATGRVAKAEVIKSPDPDLAKAAVKAVKQFRFSPAEVDGKPSPIRVQYAYNFVLEVTFTPLLPRWMRPRSDAPETKDPVAGRVREQGTRLPIPGVSVAIPDLGIEVQADGKGQFSFSNVPSGKYRVEAVATEHKRDTVEVEVKEGEQAQVTFYLQRLTVNPYETVVRGTRRKTTVTRVTLRQKELTTVPGTFGDPVRVVENLPGVARIPYVGGALIIRGANPSDSAVYLDGIEIPQIYHFLGGPSILNPAFLDRIDYYPGNADVRYGRLTAGVIDVQTKNTFTQQWSGSLDVNLLNTSVMLKAPVTEKVSIAGAVRRSYIDALMPTILKATDRSATTVVPVYYDYQLRVDVDLAGDNSLFVLAFGSDDQLEIATNEEEDPVEASLDSQITFHRLLAGWRHQISDRLTSRLVPCVGLDYVTFDVGDASVELTAITFTIREDLELKLSKRARLRFGADIVFGNGDFEAQVPVPKDYRNPGAGRTTVADTSEKVTIEGWQFGLGFYSDLQLDVTDRLRVIPGVRLEGYRYFGNNRLSAEPRLTTRYRLLTKTSLKAAVGLYSRAPEPREVNETWGNPNLNLEHALHVSGGVEHQITDAVSVDAQLYYNRGYDMAVPTDQVRVEGNTRRPLLYTNEGNAHSYGLEVILKHDVTERFYGWLAYTLSRSTRVQRAGEDPVLAPFDQSHILTMVASVKIGWGVETGMRFRLVSGRPETPVEGGYFDSDPNRWMRFLGEARSERRPLFHQLDVRIEKTWLFRLWRLSIYLDIQNVYNAENPEATLYDFRFRESGPLRGLPFLPSLGIKGSF
jgi:TonB family protein